MIDMFELLRPLSGIVPVLLILGLGYWLWRRRNRRLFGDELQPLGDPTRYALAAAVLEGSPFRRRVTDIARHPFRARAPEIGLDFPLLLAASERWERQDRALNWAIALLLLYAFAISRGLSFVLYFIFGY